MGACLVLGVYVLGVYVLGVHVLGVCCRYDFYQTDSDVFVTVLQRGIDAASVSIHLTLRDVLPSILHSNLWAGSNPGKGLGPGPRNKCKSGFLEEKTTVNRVEPLLFFRFSTNFDLKLI